MSVRALHIPAVVGLGSGGCRVLASIDVPTVAVPVGGGQRLVKAAFKVAVNSSKRDLRQVEQRVDAAILAGSGEGSGMDPERGRQDYLGVADQVAATLRRALEANSAGDVGGEADIIITIASVGHGFGSGALPEHVKLVAREFPEAVHVVICVTPFLHEAKGAFDRAYEAVTGAVEAGASPIIVSNAIAARKLGLVRGGGGVPLEEALQHVNRAVGSLITALLEGLSSIDVVVGLDKADLRRLLCPEDPQLRGVGGLAAFRCDDVAPLKGGDIVSTLYRNMYVQFRRPSNPTAMRAVLIFDLHPEDSPTVEAMDEAVLRLIDDFNLDVGYVKPLVVHRRRQGSSVIAILTGARPGRDLMILEPAEYWSTRIVGWLRRKVEARRLKERVRLAYRYGREAGVEAESPFAEV